MQSHGQTLLQPYRTPRARVPAVGLLLLWCGVLAAALAGLSVLGDGVLATPSLTDPDEWSAWIAGREPLVAAAALLRLLVLAVAWYLAATTALGVLAGLVRARRLMAVANLLTVPALRRLVRAALGAGIALAAVAPAGPTVAEAQPSPDHGHRTAEMLAPEGPAAREGDVRHPLAPLRIDRPAASPGSAPAGDGAAEAAPPAVWEVGAGEHFWGAAEQVLTETWQRQPSAAELVSYWQTLIEANRDHLVDPATPDLVYPGQVFEVPVPPVDPRTEGG